MGNTVNSRKQYIDVAKGIGIILVVVGHLIAKESFLELFIYSFHMPLFFILSGLVYKSNRYHSLDELTKKRFKTMVVPMFYFTTIVLVGCYAFRSDFYHIDDLADNFPPAYWFVTVLFFSELLYYLIDKVSLRFKNSRMVMVLFVCSLFLISKYFYQHGIVNPYNFNCIFVGTAFYALGHLSSPPPHLLNRLKINIVFFIFLSIVIIAMSLLTKDSMELANNDIPDPFVIRIVIAYCFSLSAIQLCKQLEEKGMFAWVRNLLSKIGKNTFVILMLHMFVIALCTQYIKPHFASKILYKPIEFTILWGTMCLCVLFVNRKAPWLLGKSRKGNITLKNNHY